MSKEHIPAPWVSKIEIDGGFWILSGDEIKIIARVEPRDTARANARLIAAAPKMKIACETALTYLMLDQHLDKVQLMNYLREILEEIEGKK